LQLASLKITPYMFFSVQWCRHSFIL